MTVKLLAEHDLEFLGLREGCTGSYESTFVKIPHRWRSHVDQTIEETENKDTQTTKESV